MLSYAGGDDIYRTGLDNFGRLERIFGAIDPELKDLHGIPSLEPARYTAYNLKILLDVLYSSIAVTQRIIEQERPGSILIPTRQIPGGKTRQYAFMNEESVFATILSFDGWNVPVAFLEQDTVSPPELQENAGPPSLRAWLRRRIRSSSPLMNAVLAAKQRNLLAASRAFFRGLVKGSGGPVLIYGGGYNWDDALSELYWEGWRPIHRLGDEMAGEYPPPTRFRNAVREILESHPRLQELARFRAIDTGPYLSERISAIVSDSIAESMESYRVTQELITEKGIRALLISVRERAAGHAAVQAARDAGIPVVSWQHGGAGYTFHPIMPYIECVNADLHLVFGTPVEERYRRDIAWLGWRARPSIKAVGSSSLDRMTARVSRDKGRWDDGPVLYVTTAYLQNIFIISQPSDAIGWDEHLWEVQKRVIDLAGRFPDREFIVKLHPSPMSREPLGSYILDSGNSNIRCITNEAKLEDLIPRSSIILFDLVSTGILQALLTEKPVFLYSALSQLDETASTLLKKRAVVSASLDEFIASVADYINRNPGLRASSPPGSMDFIRAYGVHEADGMSAQRAVSLLLGVVKGFPESSLESKNTRNEGGAH